MISTYRTAMACPNPDTTPFNTDFSLLMTNQFLLKEIEKGSNFVSSPLSFHVTLSLVAEGSTGKTLEQLLSFLGSKRIEELNQLSSHIARLTLPVEEDKTGKKRARTSDPTLFFINGVWVDQRYRLNPSFEGIVREVYNAEAEQVDFENEPDEARQEVNLWAERKTRGLIKEVLPPGSVDVDVAVILANAIYFKGAWDKKFDASRTQLRDFHLLNGQIVQVPFMTGFEFEEHLYGSFEAYKVLKLPYQSGLDIRQLSMYFFLPEKKDGLSNLVKMFDSIPGFFNQQFNLWRVDIPKFRIPKFKFSFEFKASETMKEMGLDRPFKRGGFLKMIDSPDSKKLFLSEVFQKACIEINEEGTEAAATTVAIIKQQQARYPIPSFVADHPFMFMIREEASRTVFFTGAVLNPLSRS